MKKKQSKVGTKDMNQLQSFTKKHTKNIRKGSNSSDGSIGRGHNHKEVIFSSQDDNESIESPFMTSSKKDNNNRYNNLF